MSMSSLPRLAELVRSRNTIDAEIAGIIGRPPLTGHLGEYIASVIFGIELHEMATHKGSDGIFRAGRLAGRSVNVKWYTRDEGLLDINPDAVPDYYLVLTGPRSPASSSRGATRPFVISSVFLFDSRSLLTVLQVTGVEVGVATSVRRELWGSAEVYPHANLILEVNGEQRRALELFRTG